MASVKCLLAFVALALVASALVEAKQEEICKQLGLAVELSDINEEATVDNDEERAVDSAEEAFKAGKKHLYKLRGLSKQAIVERDSLISAWDKVIHDAKCSPSSFDEVAVIARCMPWSDSLHTFASATQKYARQCLKPDHVADKIVSIASGSEPGVLAARKFIDSDFIRIYREANPNERLVLLKLAGGPNCCEPERAISAIVNAIKRNLVKSSDIQVEIVRSQRKLSKYLMENLFEPCKGYKEALRGTLVDLWMMEQFLGQRAQKLLQSMGGEAQNDIFRYNLCASMEDKKQQNKIVEKVFELKNEL